MDTNFEITLRKARRALRKIEPLKTPSCLGVETIGFYIERKLSTSEKKKAEEHISSCLYCLHQLLKLKELIYFQKHKVPLPSHLLNNLEDLYPKKERSIKEFFRGIISPFVQETVNFIIFPFRRWQYATVSIVTASVAIFITLALWIPEKGIMTIPKLDPNSFVQVRALNNEGRILNEANGVIIDPKGIVATNLTPIIEADLTRIILRDGRTYQVQKLWKDEEKNLALIKIEGEPFSALPMADLEKLYIGQKVLILTDPSQIKKEVGSAIISDFKGYSVRGVKGGVQYIQLASFTTQYSQGALIDHEGRLIGLVISGEKSMNLAVPLREVSALIKKQKPMPISELKNISFSPDALNYYFKGILARDAGRNDEAMEFFKKAIERNPDLEGPHLELGLLYYDKRLFDLEIKEYQNVLRINPENTDALFYLAQAYESKGLYDLAIRKYEEIIEIDPEDAETYYHLGLAYLTQGQKGKALEIHPKLKSLDPGFAEKLKRLISYSGGRS